MKYYESIPPEFPDHKSIPSKWEIGGPCPNCAAEGREGILFLVDMGDDVEEPAGVAEWGDKDGVRFVILCSEHEFGNLGCSLRHPLRSISATVAEDWDEPY